MGKNNYYEKRLNMPIKPKHLKARRRMVEEYRRRVLAGERIHYSALERKFKETVMRLRSLGMPPEKILETLGIDYFTVVKVPPKGYSSSDLLQATVNSEKRGRLKLLELKTRISNTKKALISARGENRKKLQRYLEGLYERYEWTLADLARLQRRMRELKEVKERGKKRKRIERVKEMLRKQKEMDLETRLNRIRESLGEERFGKEGFNVRSYWNSRNLTLDKFLGKGLFSVEELDKIQGMILENLGKPELLCEKLALKKKTLEKLLLNLGLFRKTS